MGSKLIASGAVAEILGVNAKTISRWAQQGRIPSVRTLGGHRRFDPDVIEAIAHELREEEPASGSEVVRVAREGWQRAASTGRAKPQAHLAAVRHYDPLA